MSWQKTARIGVAVIGIGSAVAVYATMGERTKQTVAPLPQRIDPKAMIESSGNIVQQVRGDKQDYLITADRQLTYEGGATKLVGVKVIVKNRGGHDYTVSGKEASAGPNQKDLRLDGAVRLESNDGFIVTTDAATFNQDSGVMVAPGAVKFEKDRMNGSGIGMTYDKNADILALDDQSHVELRDEHGNVTMAFTSGKATLNRMAHTLALDGMVHALRDQQNIDAMQGVAQLTDDEQHITDIQLRGDSRVAGGGTGVDSMHARDMDLHYADDHQSLQHAALMGGAAVAMTGQKGSKGRQFVGDTLDLTLAPDGSLTKAIGKDNVRLDLPGSADMPARSIKAKALDADGAPGKGLVAAKFTDEVEYREEAGKSTPARTARSRNLNVAMNDDSISNAVFTGAVKFEEQALNAAAAAARYDPMSASLQLSGLEGGVPPHVADEQVTIDANTIDVGLQGRLMKAAGGVKTILRASKAPARGGRGEGAVARDQTKLPSLLKQDQPANANGDSLDYQGASGLAVYSGNATLWQGETAIRADKITIDQTVGDLVAEGNARSTIALDTGTSVAKAAVIRYTDAQHMITYEAAKSATGVVTAQPQLSGTQGDLRGDRIEVHLAAVGGSHLDRLEAYTNVALKLDTRNAAGERLTYVPDDEQYVLTGAGTKAATVVDQCRETTGKTVTFFKGSDRVIVDGNEERRTQTRNGAAPVCKPAPAVR